MKKIIIFIGILLIAVTGYSQKIADLPTATSTSATDLVVIDQTDSTRHITIANLLADFTDTLHIDSTMYVDTLPTDASPTSFISGTVGQLKKVPIINITDIPNFALLNGRSGGQILIGGTAANNKLTLQANSASSGNLGVAIPVNVGNSGAVNALNVYHSGKITIPRTAIAATQDTIGLWLINQTAATVSQLQRSPSLIFKASGWDVDGATPTTHYMAWQLRTTSANLSLPQLYLTQSLDGSTWNDVLYIQKSQSASMSIYGATGADKLNFGTVETQLITARSNTIDIEIELNGTTADKKITFGANYGSDDITSFQYKSTGVMWHGFNTTSPTSVIDINADNIRLRTAKTPSGPTDTGTAGTICWDASYIYVCTADNTWKRVAISSGGW